MGSMNLLKSNFTGSVGNVTGVVQNGQSVIKAKIWSKRPANETQRNSVRSFEKLNRVCGLLARKWSDWLPVEQGDILLHNALAQYFKIVIENHTFDVPSFAKKVDGTAHISVAKSTFDPETAQLSFKAIADIPNWETGRASWIIVVIDTDGHVLFTTQPKGLTFDYDGTVTPTDASNIYILCFSAEKRNGKNVLTGFCPGSCVINEYWYPSLTDGVLTYRLEDEILYIDVTNYTVEDEVLTITA